MIIVMKTGAAPEKVKGIVKEIEGLGLTPFVSEGSERTIIGVVGDDRAVQLDHFFTLDGVENVIPILRPYKLVSREFHPKGTTVTVKGQVIGGKKIQVIAGPCAIESEEQLRMAAQSVKKAGVTIMRASAYKPRTSPYDFQGTGEQGLKWLKKIGDEEGLITETEVMDPRDVELVGKYADILRIGARNMQNFDLLKEVGQINKPVVLKNGLAATMKEFLLAAEYILSQGNMNVILCYRGIRSFETAIRFPLDIGMIPMLKKETHLPLIVDPSHSMGTPDIVKDASKGIIAAGADGLLVDVHCHPDEALCDGKQALTPGMFYPMMEELKAVAHAVGREL